MTDVFDFPPVFVLPDFEDVEQHDEGPVPRRPPGLPVSVGQRPSTFRLHRVEDGMQMVELTVFDVPNFSYDPPPGHVPQGAMQWRVRHPGAAFVLYGSVFHYRSEANSYWDREG